MSSVPGPRTNPTVKPLANSNQSNLRTWRISLGPIQTVVLVGLLTGLMACAFYLGFFSGQKVGIETALNNNLSSTMRLPIENEPGEAESGDSEFSDVYAKLNDVPGQNETDTIVVNHKGGRGAEKSAEMPELGSIQSTENAPVAEALKQVGSVAADLDAAKRLGTEKTVTKEAAAAQGAIPEVSKDVRVLGDPSNSAVGSTGSAASNATLGAMAREAGVSGRSQKQTASDASAKVASAEDASDKKTNQALNQGSASSLAGAVNDQTSVEVKKATVEEIAQARREVAKESLQESKAVVAQAPSAAEKPSLPRGWFAQIIAPRSQQEADSITSKLRSSGFSVVIENATVRGENYYRVLVGPEETRQQAERLISQLRREPYVKSDPFLRMVK